MIKIGTKDAKIVELLENGEFSIIDGVVTLKDGRPASVCVPKKTKATRVWIGGAEFSLARVVLVATVGVPVSDVPMVSRYKDGNPENCRPENLHWGTRGDALRDSYVLRGHKPRGPKNGAAASYGEANANCKISDAGRADIIQKRLYTKPPVSVAVLAEQYKVGTPAIYAVVRRYKEQQEKENKNNDNTGDNDV